VKDDENEVGRPAKLTLYIGFLSIAFAGYFSRQGFPSDYGWLDWTCIVGTFALVGWLITSPDRSVDADSHEGAGQGFAFRLGKKLNRVLHNFKR